MTINPLDRLTRVIPDWPVEGVSFQDLTGVLADSEGLAYVAEELAAPFRDAGVTLVAGMEARGFIVGTAVFSFISNILLYRISVSYIFFGLMDYVASEPIIVNEDIQGLW